MEDQAKEDRPEKRLIVGRQMRCPRCERLQDILRYVPMEQMADYASETSPIYKCPTCRWIFSPAPHVLEVFVER